MKKKIIKNKYSLLLGLLFAVILLAGYLTNYYDVKFQEVAQEVFPTSEKGGFSLFSVYQVTNIPDKDLKSGAMISLKPGEEIKATLALKNHDPKWHLFKIDVEEFSLLDQEKLSEAGGLPSIEIQESEIGLASGDVVFFDYTVKVPKDARNGNYQASFAAKTVDPDKEKLVVPGAVFDFAVGVKINLVVSDSAQQYEYKVIPEEIGKFTKDFLLVRIRYGLSFFLFLLCGYFLYRAFKVKK